MSKSTRRLAAAFDAIGSKPSGITVTELAEALRLDKGTSSRLLSSLVDAGFITKAADSRRHFLNPRFWVWGVWALRDARLLYELARPMLIETVRETGVQVVFSVLHNLETIFVTAVVRENGAIIAMPVGNILPLHASSSGKAMLAFQPASRIREVLKRPMRRFTERTITDPRALEQELAQVRSQGYAISRGEVLIENAAVAVPIFNSQGVAVAAVSTAIADTDYTKLEPRLPSLRRLSRSISAAMGDSPMVRMAAT